MVKLDKYIHEYHDKKGVTHYAVCQWDEQHNQWTAPLDPETKRLTGCHTEFAGTLAGIGGYTDRKKAVRRAKLLYGH